MFSENGNDVELVIKTTDHDFKSLKVSMSNL